MVNEEDRRVPFDSCMYKLMVFVNWCIDRGG